LKQRLSVSFYGGKLNVCFALLPASSSVSGSEAHSMILELFEGKVVVPGRAAFWLAEGPHWEHFVTLSSPESVDSIGFMAERLNV